MNIKSLLESSNQYKVIADDAKKLAKKWIKSGLLEGITDENDRNTLSMLLENQAKQLVTEASATGGAAGTTGAGYNAEGWNGVALPLVRRVFGEIAAKEFVSVQPMNLPSGLVFYLDFKYGTNDVHFGLNSSLYGANAVTNVTDIISESLYGAGQFGYSLNNFSASITATTGSGFATWADFNFDSDFSASAAASQYKKLLVPLPTMADPNAVRSFFISGSIISGSNTSFGIYGPSSTSNLLQGFTALVGTGTALTASFLLTSSLFVSGTAATGGGSGSNGVQSTTLYFTVEPSLNTSGYRGDFEDNSIAGGMGNAGDGGYPSNLSNTTISIPEINVALKSEAIVAKTRKLKAQWTPEFAQDLNAYHSVDAEAELTGILSQYISMEIDLELLDMLIQNAFTVDYWSAINNTVYSGTAAGAFNAPNSATSFYNTQGGWFQTLGTKLQKVSNRIHQLTLRGGANFLVMSPTVATILESIPGFAADGTGEKLEYNFGIQKVGSLNSRYKVYKNPYMTENVILMGYKGTQFLECGAVFAPYVPLIMTPLLYDPSTFTPRKGLMTRYAKKMIRPDYYGKIYVSGLNTI